MFVVPSLTDIFNFTGVFHSTAAVSLNLPVELEQLLEAE